MRILKSHPLLKLANSYVIDSPQPSNISYLWNFGSLLAFCLIIQIITGVTLAMHYNPSVLEAFNSVEHIMRDVNNGWLIRYLHSNTASAFFFIVYLHIGRGLYYGSYRAPRTLVWTIGTVIFVLMIATAFLGYKRSPKWFKSNDNINSLVNNRNKFKHFTPKATRSNTAARNYSIKINPNNNETDPIVEKFLIDKNLRFKFIYDNIGNAITKQKLMAETKNLSGIYLILNKVTSDYYIGSASTGRFYSRFSNHLFNFNGNKIIKNAVKKYHISSFTFIILELFPETVTRENNRKLLDLEDFYLKSLLPNYNILTEAGSSFGYKHSEISRIKMKSNYSEQRRATIGSLNRGKNLKQETVNILREKALERGKVNYSLQPLANMEKKAKAVLIYNLDYTVYAEYSSIAEAAKCLDCSVKTVFRALKSEKKLLKKRWIVKYIN